MNGLIQRELTLGEVGRAAIAKGTLAHCHGIFDLLHLGHLAHLQEAKEIADTLVVTVTADAFVRKGAGRPLFTGHERAIMISSLSCVDYAAIIEAPNAAEAIRELRPNFYVKGTDYKNQIASEEISAIEEVGGYIIHTRSLKIRTTDIIRRCKEIAL